ncbi:NAD(P)/FAD-dependent oxidoreductase [Streptomyces sp. BI20]|uniref:NAD(P)/FAD-dependent oxidoreductase n=1 Tax=Streptomyces sp. BI20 TaxID=3403460 RepID=UPI003C743912
MSGDAGRSGGRPRTAVIGAGVSGLTAAYVLRRAHDVTLYEAADRLGGHAHTHEVKGPDGEVRAVDSGFIVHNDRTYPLLNRLFGELGVTVRDTVMSMSVRCPGCGLEYAGAKGPRGLFTRPRSVVDAAYLRMLARVPAFHRAARRLLARPAAPGGPEVTLGEFLRAEGFDAHFTAHFAAPLVACVWSCPAGTALRYPARYLFRFLDHHGLLSITGSPRWRTVVGGSAAYVERLRRELPSVRAATPVRSVTRLGGPGAPDGVEVRTADGAVARYDAVVIAVHADRALELLADPTPAERGTLGAFGYSRNVTVLHTDDSVLPRSAGARACWNLLLPGCLPDSGQVRVSYDMNLLQGLDGPRTHVVSLGARPGEIDPGTVIARMEYEHPVYTPESVAAQVSLPGLSGPRVAFAGAYHGWGFHEDGCRSGVAAAEALGVRW